MGLLGPGICRALERYDLKVVRSPVKSVKALDPELLSSAACQTAAARLGSNPCGQGNGLLNTIPTVGFVLGCLDRLTRNADALIDTFWPYYRQPGNYPNSDHFRVADHPPGTRTNRS